MKLLLLAKVIVKVQQQTTSQRFLANGFPQRKSVFFLAEKI